MKKCRTSEVAQMMGIHPNTVRFYEEWGLITKPIREENRYRVFNDLHLYQIQAARLGFAKAICNQPSLEMVERHGKQPKVMYCDNADREHASISALIKEFEEGGNAS